MPRPLILVSANVRAVDDGRFHGAAERYFQAVIAGAGGLPVVLPALAGGMLDEAHLADALAVCDGLLLTGSRSNIQPERYGAAPAPPDDLQDHARDATSLAIIPLALKAGVPLLAICRGMQELNVALGGTLHPHLPSLPGRFDHCIARDDDPDEVQFAPAHDVTLTPGTQLADFAGGAARWRVNSLHDQGLARLGEGLRAIAAAEDGTIEAVDLPGARGFALATQWHPEWGFAGDRLSAALFRAFGRAAEARRAGRAQPPS